MIETIKATVEITEDELRMLSAHVGRVQLMAGIGFQSFSVVDKICQRLVDAAIDEFGRMAAKKEKAP